VADPANGTAAASEPGVRGWWLRLDGRTRARLKILLAAGIVVVALVAVVLARFLSAENAERDADLALIEAQARGDVRGMLSRLQGCSARPSCVATVRANAANPRLRRHGAVKILQLESDTAYALTGATGQTRLAWTVIGKLPVVQCVKVKRTGNVISGIHVHLLALSAPIDNEAAC